MKQYIKNLFKDKEGNVVVAQKPNRLIIVAAALYLLSRLDISMSQDLYVYSMFALGVWAYEEMARGVNTWRKILGVIVMLIALNNLVGTI